MADDIKRQLDELDKRREDLADMLQRSNEMLQTVDAKIAEFKRRQDARLAVDERFDDSLVEKIAGPVKLKPDQSAAVKKQLETTNQERLIPTELTSLDVHVQRSADESK